MLISSLTDTFIPPRRPIEQLLLVCDVDGVIRSSTKDDADPRIISAIRVLIAKQNVDVAFISGTPIVQDPFLDTWRRGHFTLDKALGSLLMPELEQRKVTIIGAMGGQRMVQAGKIEKMDEYPIEIAFELSRLLLSAFLEEVGFYGTPEQKKLGQRLQKQIEELKLLNLRQPASVTADEFMEIVQQIRSQLDADFCLINYGSFVETHTSHPLWNIERSYKWLKDKLESHHRISQIVKEERQLAGGLSNRGEGDFNFLMISKTNKGKAIKKYIEEKQRNNISSLIITVGDTQVDFPMHQHAHLAYHVGQEQVWKNHYLPHCLLIRDKLGRDCQHVSGTLYLLNKLNEGFGKPISEWGILPKNSP